MTLSVSSCEVTKIYIKRKPQEIWNEQCASLPTGSIWRESSIGGSSYATAASF